MSQPEAAYQFVVCGADLARVPLSGSSSHSFILPFSHPPNSPSGIEKKLRALLHKCRKKAFIRWYTYKSIWAIHCKISLETEDSCLRLSFLEEFHLNPLVIEQFRKADFTYMFSLQIHAIFFWEILKNWCHTIGCCFFLFVFNGMRHSCFVTGSARVIVSSVGSIELRLFGSLLYLIYRYTKIIKKIPILFLSWKVL